MEADATPSSVPSVFGFKQEMDLRTSAFLSVVLSRKRLWSSAEPNPEPEHEGLVFLTCSFFIYLQKTKSLRTEVTARVLGAPEAVYVAA